MTYTVTASEFIKELPGKGDRGPLNIFKLTLDTGGSSFPNVEMLQKPETPAPEVGQKLEGQIQQTDFGPRFRKAQKPFGEGKGGGGGRSPQETKAIQRQHSQDAGSRAYFKELELGLASKPEDSKEFYRELVKRIDYFERDITLERDATT